MGAGLAGVLFCRAARVATLQFFYESFGLLTICPKHITAWP